MKKLLLLTFGLQLALSAFSQSFTYSYAGTTLNYSIVDADNRTCSVSYNSNVSGNVIIPDEVMYNGISYTVSEIAWRAFFNDYNLKSVQIPNTVTEIWNEAFAQCKYMDYIKLPDGIETIGTSVFRYCEGLKTIEIPNSVKHIGYEAFEECTGLEYIVIPNSVISIANDAFNVCPKLKCVTIGNSVESIGSLAFGRCDLRHTIIPSHLKDIWQYDYAYSYNYTSDPGYRPIVVCYDPTVAEVDKEGCVYSTDGKTLYAVPNRITDSFEIPSGVTTIAKNAFAACKINTLTIPSSIINVEADAFPYKAPESIWDNEDPSNCVINRVYFEDWSKWYANAKLGNLSSNPYRNSEAYAGGIKIVVNEIDPNAVSIPDYIHAGVADFKNEIEIPAGIKRIGAYAFYNNKDLYTAILPEGIEEIGESAFEGCEILENPILPSTLNNIEDHVFANCSSITEITLPQELTSLGNGVFENCSSLEKAVLVANIDRIGDSLFRGCSSLYKIYFPLQLKSIGKYAFAETESFEDIKLPSSLELIDDYAFANAHAITRISIPDNVTHIGEGAFYDQPISYLTIGTGLNSIGEKAFAQNSNGSIQIVALPDGFTELGKDAFKNCNIGKLSIPDLVRELPSGSCGIPSVLTIGSGVKSIYADAFMFDNLKVIRMKATTPPSLSDNLNITMDQNDALTMIVNNGRERVYKTNSGWRQIDNIVEESASEVTIYMTGDYAISEEIRTTTGLMPSSVTKMKVIGPMTDLDLRIIKENMTSLLSLDLSNVTNLTEIPDYQFYNMLLTDVKLPSNLRKIGNYAFAECKLMQIDKLPDGITEIGESAFNNCGQLTISNLPEKLSSIGNNAFYNSGIREISCGKNLEYLGQEVFSNCTNLEKIDLSESHITMIPVKTFQNCSSLDEIQIPETVKTIQTGAFSSTAVRDLSFIHNVESIGYNSFASCRRLVAANLPEKVTTIPSSTFANCPRLISTSMPSGMQSVSVSVYYNDKKLANISCAAIDAPEAETGAFDGVRERYVSLTVPVMSYRSYLNAPQWGKFKTILNRIPVSIDPGIDVTNITEDDYQEMLAEDALEEASDEANKISPRHAARRAAARAATSEGRSFAALFDGAQIQNGNDGGGTRIFVNPHEGVTITSIKFNDEEMLAKLDGNSLLLPARSNGTLIIRTDAPEESKISSVESTSTEICVYNLDGVKVGESLEGLAKGVYIVRQGAKTSKIAI